MPSSNIYKILKNETIPIDRVGRRKDVYRQLSFRKYHAVCYAGEAM